MRSQPAPGVTKRCDRRVSRHGRTIPVSCFRVAIASFTRRGRPAKSATSSTRTDRLGGVELRCARRADGRAPKNNAKGKFRIAYYAAVDGHYAGVTLISSFRNWLTKPFLDLELFEVNDPLPDVLARLNEFQPEVLIGYTTALKILATEQRRGALSTRPRHQRHDGGAKPRPRPTWLCSADTFGCPIVNSYACSEHLGMGALTAG